MKNFASLYKKRFREMLAPHGYKSKGSTFYRLEDEVFFTIRVSRYTLGTRPDMGVFPVLHVFVGMYVYYRDLAGYYDSISWGGELWEILRRTTYDKMSVEELCSHYSKITDARDEESTMNALELLGDDFENLILPYIHRFADLEFFYAEKINLCMTPQRPLSSMITEEMKAAYHNPYPPPPPFVPYKTAEEVIERNPVVFHLSIKLRKYDCAIMKIDNTLLCLNNNLKDTESELFLLHSGGLTDNLKTFQKYLPKELPDAVERNICAAENAIIKWQNEKLQWQKMKDALLANDHAFIDDYILKTEKASREYVEQVFAGKKQKSE